MMQIQNPPHPPARRDREGEHPARFGPGPLTALRGGCQAMIFVFSHPAWLAPRLYKRHRHCGPRDLEPALSPSAFPIPRKKERVQARRVVRWRISIFLGPLRRIFVLARGHWFTSIFYLLFLPGHFTPSAAAARGRYLTPAHFPPALPLLPPNSCAYRKRGSNLFVLGGRHESEERNKTMREVASFGTVG